MVVHREVNSHAEGKKDVMGAYVQHVGPKTTLQLASSSSSSSSWHACTTDPLASSLQELEYCCVCYHHSSEPDGQREELLER